MKPPIYEPHAESDLFGSVFHSGSGGCVRDCTCGRTHFDTDQNNGWTWDEGEFEGLEAKAKGDPDRYIGQYGTVTTMEIGGESIVHGCPCNRAARYEKFINTHARMLAEYLNKKAAELQSKSAAMKVEVANG